MFRVWARVGYPPATMKRARTLKFDDGAELTLPAASPPPTDVALVAAGEPGSPIPPMPVYAVSHDVIMTALGATEEQFPRVFHQFRWRDLPLAFHTAFTKAHGEDMVGGNPVTGEIQHMWHDGELVRARVAFYDTAEGRYAAQLAASGSVRFVSVDPGGVEAELVITDEETGAYEWHFHDYVIGAATQVSVPARPQAVISKPVFPSQGEHQAMAAAGELVEAPLPAGEGAAMQPEPHFQILKPAEFEPQLQHLVASGVKRDAVAEAFSQTEPTDPLRYEGAAELSNVVGTEIAVPFVQDDGVIWSGYLAQWGSCHVGYEGVCKPPPSDDDFHWFAREVMAVDDGSLERQVGHITIGTGHAKLSMTASAAVEHYDDTGSRVAYAEFINGQHGIWGRGIINPSASDDQVLNFHRSRISGDWRSRNGRLALIAALVVNYPGFPIPDLAVGHDEHGNDALVASGIIPIEPPEEAAVSGPNLRPAADRMARALGLATSAERRQARRQELAAKVGNPVRRVRVPRKG